MRAGLATLIRRVLVGWIIQRIGKENLDKVLPASVTGPIAIAIALAKEALDVATDNRGIALCTMVATILFSVYLRGLGLIGMLPILLGLIFGYVIAAIAGDVDFTVVGDLPLRRHRRSGHRPDDAPTHKDRRRRRADLSDEVAVALALIDL